MSIHKLQMMHMSSRKEVKSFFLHHHTTPGSFNAIKKLFHISSHMHMLVIYIYMLVS